ncbi:hypothetical protein [Ligilactobacillus agilis]|uniref:hypothetical protein n=1 Tax=Ligilactobacillus agilis TaxID=1601 RepID=UPI00255CDEA7|nr:hypothetical protein [Ligilactobacillus agilis]
MVTVCPFATGKIVSEEVALELAFCLTKIKLAVRVTTANLCIDKFSMQTKCD